MSVRCSQQLGAPRGQPAVACLALALRAVPVATRVIGDGAMAAAGALIQMAAHRGGAAPLDGYQDFKMHPGEPRGGRSMNRWLAAAMISCCPRCDGDVANSRSGPFIHFLREPFFGFGAAARVSES